MGANGTLYPAHSPSCTKYRPHADNEHSRPKPIKSRLKFIQEGEKTDGRTIRNPARAHHAPYTHAPDMHSFPQSWNGTSQSYPGPSTHNRSRPTQCSSGEFIVAQQ
eukprot:scpid108362/ scgid26105/ 